MPAIFISHSSRDNAVAADLTAALKRLDFEAVFLDFDKDTGIGAGADWEKTLYEQLSRCHAIVLLLTPHWLTSTWCRIELAAGRFLGKVILPVICSPLGEHYVLPEIQSVDLIDWRGDGLERLRKRLLAITDELARGFPLDSGRPPYPGIHAFEAKDAAIYYGRDEETRATIEKLDARRTQGGARLVVVIGASGAGKSSLLKAGVLPQLKRRRGQWLPLPPMRPEKAPLEALAKSLAQHLGKPDEWRAWHEALAGADAVETVARVVQDLRVGEASAATLLIAIDQFEEVFTLAEVAERTAFLTLLAAILDPTRGLPVMAVATGRADVLEGLLETGALAPLMDTAPLLPMPIDRVPRLVEGPAAVASLVVEKGLADRIMRDVESPEALPLLAYTLRLLHDRCADKRLTLADYLTLGDPAHGLNPVQNAVRRGADDAIDRVKPTPEEMAALRDAFIPHLVRLRLDDKRHVRRPAPRAALPREADRLIGALIDARLLTARSGDGEKPVVEVAHEALFSAWPTLHDWLDAEQGFLTDIERLKSAHETWVQAPEAQKPQALVSGLLLSRARDWLVKHAQRFLGDDMEPLRAFIADSATAADAEYARARRLRQRIVQGMAATIVILAGAAIIAVWQYVEADSASRDAVAQRVVAESKTKLAFQREEEARRAREDAERENREAEAARDLAKRNFSIAKQAANDVVFKLARDLRNAQGMRVEWVRRIIDAAQALMDQLARAAPDDLELQRSRAIILNEFTLTYLEVEDMVRARMAAEESLAIMRKLTAIDPRNTEWRYGLGVSLYRVGDVQIAAGEHVGALAACEESLAVMRVVTAAKSDNTAWRRDLSVALSKVGEARRAAGDVAGALIAQREGLAIVRQLADTDPANTLWQRDVGVSLERVGNALQDTGDSTAALAAYEEALAIRRKLVVAGPSNALWQRDVSVGLDHIGEMRLAMGDRAKALAAYEESLVIRRKLVAADPGNAQAQRDLDLSLLRLGDMRLAAKDRAGALSRYEESLAIRRKLVIADPGNALWQIDLAIGLYKVGTVSDPRRARQALSEALAIAEVLAREDKLRANQKGWPQVIRDALAKLQPKKTDAR